MKKLCIIYANCQGRAIETFLLKHDIFRNHFDIRVLENYKLIAAQSALPLDILQKADLFIFQPVHQRHGSFSTSHIKQHLSPHCQTVSFPYLYNDGLWPLFEEGDKVKGEEAIIRLIKHGYSFVKIINMFRRGQIDFQLKQRFQCSLDILIQKEQTTDVKVSEYILKNLGKKKLFLTQNHQTSSIYLHCVNQMLERLGYRKINMSTEFHPNEAQLPDCWPQSPYETETFDYKYCCDWKIFHPEQEDSNWLRFNIKIISKIYCKRTHSSIARVLSRIYAKILIKWSLLRNDGYLKQQF